MDLTEKLYESFAEHGPALIIQDEAHLLHPELLEEYRLIGNLETGGAEPPKWFFYRSPISLKHLKIIL